MTRVCRTACLLLAAFVLVAMGCAPAPPQTSGPSDSSGGPSLFRGFLFYVPNRIIDLTDVVSFGVAVPAVPYLLPASAHVNAHVTRAAQIGLGNTHGIFLGKGYGRRFTWGLKHDELSAGPFTVCELKYMGRSTADAENASVERVGVLLPLDEPFAKGLMDYWAVGAHVGLLPVAVQADAHPIEIADFLLGFLLIDIRGDDY